MTEDRWLDGIANSMDMSLSKLWEILKGRGSLPCCSPWGCKESDMTQQLNNITGWSSLWSPLKLQPKHQLGLLSSDWGCEIGFRDGVLTAGCWQEALVSCPMESSTELLEFSHYMASPRWMPARKTEAPVPWNARVVLSTLSSWPRGGSPLHCGKG